MFGEIGVDGWLTAVRHVPSRNYDDRPENCDVSLIVIHGISLPPGVYGGSFIEEFFCNRLNPLQHPYFSEIGGETVSAHLLIDRLGEVVQFVSFNRRAWHAGLSNYEGRDNCNDYSIGIELEGVDDSPYTDAQYLALIGVSQLLFGAYPNLDVMSVVGHSDIAPGRKTDPGPAFDWSRYQASLPLDLKRCP